MAKTPSSDAESRVVTRSPRSSGLSKARFDEVFKLGKRVSTAHFRLTTDQGIGRLGIATAKKIGCHARRNWVKRRIRESIYSLESPLAPHLDYIVIATPNVVNMEFAAMAVELAEGLNRMNQRWADDLESS